MDPSESNQPPPPPPAISDRVLIDGTVAPLTLTAEGMLVWSGGRQRSLSVEKEVLEFDAEGPRIRVKAIVDDAGDRACCVGSWSGGGLVRKDFVFEPLSEESKKLWCEKLRGCLDSLDRPKKLFILLNPFGGKKVAPKTLANVVKPLLEDAGIQFDIQETQYQLHAKEVTRSLDLSKYDGIVCVSGDGILVEVVNGLLEREDWEAAIKVPIGMVPAGTGNGMVKSLLDSVGEPCTASYATLAIIRGHKKSLDVATIKQGDAKVFSVLMLAWGLVADIDIESEKYRWMGSARIDFYALQRILHLRRYSGRISFVPAPGYETHGEPTTYSGNFGGKDIVFEKSEGSSAKVEGQGYQGPDIKLEELSWRSIDGPFVSIWLHNVPWGAEDSMAAPDAKLSDGCLDLIAIGDCPKFSLLSLMTKLNDGGHVKSPRVIYMKVKAFILEPGPRIDDPTKEGIIDTDGEVLAKGNGTFKSKHKTMMAYDRLLITLDQGLATVFSPI
ncbi:DAGKc domain-containing protein [Psidium guajava]|nr:DAGKc domain-containing protein [Psidium guajava]